MQTRTLLSISGIVAAVAAGSSPLSGAPRRDAGTQPAAPSAPGAAVDPAALLRKTDEIRGAVRPWSFSLKMVDQVGQTVKQPTELKVYVRGADEEVFRSLVLWTGPPAERGKVMLMDGNVYWLYSPGTRNAIRISPAQRFAGLASSADIASTNFGRDYRVESVVRETADGVDAYKLAMVGKTNEVAYHKIALWVNAKTAAPIKASYYAVSGRLLKTAQYRDYRDEMGAVRPHEILIVDAVRVDRKTRLLYSDMKLEEKPLHMYRKEFLPNVRQ
jgi:hypothetical protein